MFWLIMLAIAIALVMAYEYAKIGTVARANAKAIGKVLGDREPTARHSYTETTAPHDAAAHQEMIKKCLDF